MMTNPHRLRLRSVLPAFLCALAASCASVPLATEADDADSKQFLPPPEGLAGVYVFRDGRAGGALLKTVWLDGEEVGETAPRTFFHWDVEPGAHTLATESEFGDNELLFEAIAGQNHFFRQRMKIGVFVGGSELEAVAEAEGSEAVRACSQALRAVELPDEPPPKPRPKRERR